MEDLAVFRDFLAVLACWRIASLLTYDKTLLFLRTWAGVYYPIGEDGLPEKFLGKILDCFWCNTMIGAVVVFGLYLIGAWYLVAALGLSGGAILLNHYSRIYRDVGGE